MDTCSVVLRLVEFFNVVGGNPDKSLAMACAWLISTSLATIAILRRMAQQHHEWMIRSYVVTFGFITFRALIMIFDLARVGTLVDRMTAASWLAWSVPL